VNHLILTLFGSIAVTIMMLSYWLEPRSKRYVLVFALASAATSVYSGMAGAYPITIVEAAWSLVALRRLRHRHRTEQPPHF
jgi:hypothetical protein